MVSVAKMARLQNCGKLCEFSIKNLLTQMHNEREIFKN